MRRQYAVHFRSNHFDHLANFTIAEQEDKKGYWWGYGRHSSLKRAISVAKTLLKKRQVESMHTDRISIIDAVCVVDEHLEDCYESPVFYA